jgi:two-component system cell cycle response regulator
MSATCLIVETSPRRRLALEERARKSSIFGHILFCNDWQEATRHLQERHVDILFACGESLAEDSYHGLGALSRLEKASSVPIAAFFPEDDLVERLSALENGVWDCLDYTTPAPEVSARLHRHLENHRRIEELLHVRAILTQEACTDVLTGVFNRRHFNEALEAETARSLRSREPFALLMVDIDHFKRINDTCGHSTGDTVLRAVAGAIGGAVRSYDTLCRFGGEEFALLMPKASAANALQVAKRVAQKVAALASKFPKLPCQLTVSIGISHSPASPAAKPEQLIEEADAALYRAKEKGRNRTEIYSSDIPLPGTPSEQVA